MASLCLQCQDVLTACHCVVRRVTLTPLTPWVFYVLQLLSACYDIRCVVQEEGAVSKLRVRRKVGTALCGAVREWVVKCCGR